ncbi:MAG: cytochrome c [Pirellulales bacterium]
MKTGTKIALAVTGATLGLAVAGGVAAIRHGFSARDAPTAIEAFVARRVRLLAIPREARDKRNPIISLSKDLLADARAHFADHCAICHANDGSGNTQIGRNLYPKAPDMREAETQSLSDGEIFYIIHNGIRLSGMPAWGGADPDEYEDSWKLVHFIRHLPQLTADELVEMKKLNPKGPHELEEEKEVDEFLRGEGKSAPSHQH